MLASSVLVGRRCDSSDGGGVSHAVGEITADGEIVGEITLSIALDRVQELEAQLRDIERERRGERARVRFLLAQIEDDRDSYERREEVVSIFNEWREKCKHKSARLTNDRFDAIRRLLDITKPQPYPREAFTAAIGGAAYNPYLTQRKNGSWKRHDDIALICRSGEKFEEFIKRAPKEGE